MNDLIKERDLVLVRHMATVNNKSGVIMGRRIDAGILESEKEPFQKKILALTRNPSLRLDQAVVISSPRKRCSQTAELIREQAGIISKIVFKNQFDETDMGEFSGKRGQDLRDEYGGLIDLWMFQPEEFGFPNGEAYSEVEQRVSFGLKWLISTYSDQTVILVSHVDIIKMILSKVLDFPFNNRRYLVVPPGSISVVRILADERMQIIRINAF
jgi:broad specificity phosphatase PhoE